MGELSGLYRGICVRVDDPEQRSRIMLQVPQVLGTQVTDWAWPCRAPVTDHEHEGLPDPTPHASVPAVGQGVWVMFEAGDPDLPVWMGVF